MEKKIKGNNEWFDVPGYENEYQITRDGIVRSKPRYVNSPAAGGRRLLAGKEIKTRLIKGYPAFHPCVGGKKRTVYIHRLLAMLFVPNPDNKPYVNHIDGRKDNNEISNLEWCTHKENMRHAFMTGLATYPDVGPGERSPSSKLRNEDVIEIKKRIAMGEGNKSIARDFGVSPGTIGFIKTGETWSHISVTEVSTC